MRAWPALLVAAFALPAAAQEVGGSTPASASDSDEVSAPTPPPPAASTPPPPAASTPPPPAASGPAKPSPKGSVVVVVVPTDDVADAQLRAATPWVHPPIDGMLRALTARRDPPGDREGRTVWYGDQILLNDGISVVTSPIVVGLFGYLGAPFVVHSYHGRVGRAFASVALRIGLPLFGGFLGYATCGSYCHSDDPIIGGIALGILGAIAIDAFGLAYDDQPRIPTRRVRPLIQPRTTGGVLGMTVTF